MNNFGIPSVDLALFTKGNESEKQKFVAEIGAAYEDVGFVAVKNHGISDELIKQLYRWVQDFFALPLDIKCKYEIEGLGGQRGYTSFGKEHAKNSSAGDLKEFWHFGQYTSDKSINYPDNIDVDELPEFNKVGKEAYQQLEKTGQEILKALALFLDLQENYFDEFVEDGNSILRPIHYPPIKGEPKNAVRAGEHEDINLITLLIGAAADGLQVKNKKGEWVPVTVLEDHIVVNVGDMLQRLCNGRLKSTTHRVVNPPREEWGKSRFSIPFFLHPKSSMPLNCLSSCITKENPKQFDDITAGEYLTQRLREIGLIK